MMAPTTPTGSRTSRPNSPPDGVTGSSKGEGLGQTGVVLERRRRHRCPRTERWSAARRPRGATPGRDRRSVPSARRRSPAGTRPARRGTSGARAPCRMPPGRPLTALAISVSWASATVRKTSSLVESITRMVASEEGFTHVPPMKKRSACFNEAAVSFAKVMDSPPHVFPHLLGGTDQVRRCRTCGATLHASLESLLSFARQVLKRCLASCCDEDE